MGIRGCIEFAASVGTIAGWVRDDDSSAEVELQLCRDGAPVAYGKPTRLREDIGGLFGYSIEAGNDLRLFDLLDGRLQLWALSSATEGRVLLGPTNNVREQALQSFVDATVTILRKPDLEQLTQQLILRSGAEQDSATSLLMQNKRDRAYSEKLLSGLEVASRLDGVDPDFATIGVPVGFVSSDGTAVIGRNGVLYLVGGSNGVLEQYCHKRDSPALASTATDWASLFKRRRDELALRSIEFVQLMIPEKIAVMPECFPRVLPPRSPLLELLEGMVASMSMSEFYVSGFDILSGLPAAQRGAAFPDTDSHLSAGANLALLEVMLARMNIALPAVPGSYHRNRITGDLASRFFGVPLHDEIDLPDRGFIEEFSRGLELVEAFSPEKGHIGTRYVWKNTAACSQLKVVAFGNSFMERGGDARSLSWWCARIFREFHFVWHPRIDYDYVDKEKPDWVVAQTIERFLPVVPAS